MTKAEREAQQADKNEITSLHAKVAELEKKLSDAKSTSDMWYRNSQERNKEIEDVHGILDVLPNAPNRKIDGGYETRPLMARLAGYFAAR
jgi:uncharacterized protein YlxW (UPF0749 family)